MSYVIESLFYHENLKCCVIMTDLGYRCGYVGIDPTHPLFRIDYNQDIKSPELLQELKNSTIGKRGIIDIFCWDGEATTPALLFDVHGGITYSGESGRYPTIQIEPLWWFGFDCGHCNDAKDWQAMEKYFVRSKWQLLYDLERQYPTYGTVRTKEYVEQECKNLAKQLQCVGELLKQTRLQIS